LLDWIERDRDELVRFLQDFFRHKSPNPPGDTRSTAKFITTVLDQQLLPYRVISPHPEMPNIVGAFDAPTPGAISSSMATSTSFPWPMMVPGGARTLGRRDCRR
jgi:hypothetical protein